jgi:hypothetical protein
MSKKLYNYVTNTFGISKELILEQVNSRVEDLINKHIASLLKSNKVEKMIINSIADYIVSGKIDSRFLNRKNFSSLIDDQIKNIIEKYLRDRCQITFQFNNNSIRFIQED